MTRSSAEDYVYLVGSDFFTQNMSSPSGIEKIVFELQGSLPVVRYPLTPGSPGVDVDLIGSRLIRCKLPDFLDIHAGVYDVAIVFENGGGCPSGPGYAEKIGAIRIDEPSTP